MSHDLRVIKCKVGKLAYSISFRVVSKHNSLKTWLTYNSDDKRTNILSKYYKGEKLNIHKIIAHIKHYT